MQSRSGSLWAIMLSQLAGFGEYTKLLQISASRLWRFGHFLTVADHLLFGFSQILLGHRHLNNQSIGQLPFLHNAINGARMQLVSSLVSHAPS